MEFNLLYLSIPVLQWFFFFPGMHQCEIISIEKIVSSWENTREVLKLNIMYC